MESMTRVWSTLDPQQAELVRVILQEHGIECMIENQGFSQLVLTTSAAPLVVTIRKVDEGRATGVLRDLAAGRLKGLEIPAEFFTRLRCTCGKDLEIPLELEDSGFDCPYCGRSTAGLSGAG